MEKQAGDQMRQLEGGGELWVKNNERVNAMKTLIQVKKGGMKEECNTKRTICN